MSPNLVTGLVALVLALAVGLALLTDLPGDGAAGLLGIVLGAWALWRQSRTRKPPSGS